MAVGQLRPEELAEEFRAFPAAGVNPQLAIRPKVGTRSRRSADHSDRLQRLGGIEKITVHGFRSHELHYVRKCALEAARKAAFGVTLILEEVLIMVVVKLLVVPDFKQAVFRKRSEPVAGRAVFLQFKLVSDLAVHIQHDYSAALGQGLGFEPDRLVAIAPKRLADYLAYSAQSQAAPCPSAVGRRGQDQVLDVAAPDAKSAGIGEGFPEFLQGVGLPGLAHVGLEIDGGTAVGIIRITGS